MNYDNLLHTENIERKNSDYEEFSESNCEEDLDNNERENLVALTFVAKEPNLALGLKTNDVIVYQRQNDNSYKAIKIERYLYEAEELESMLIDSK